VIAAGPRVGVGAVGTVGGAAIGGIIGNQIEPKK